MLSINNLRVNYGAREVIHGINLEVRTGEIVTLIGSNGAGKTTLLKAISGVNKITGGTIEWKGERIERLAPHKIVSRGIAHVPEGRLLFRDMTVFEHLEMGAVQAAAGKQSFAERVDWVYTLFPILKERHMQLAGTLSGGQQQLVAIARGLMASPTLLILDEPTLGLAPTVIDQLTDTIRELHRTGLAILLVEQRVDMALSLASRGYVFETGRIVLADDAAALLKDPRVKEAYLGV
ncbi:MAG: livF [Polaromonas sp.]|nr:livF [Polaromonas sp.]